MDDGPGRDWKEEDKVGTVEQEDNGLQGRLR